jgi:hypothetical protein
MMNKILKKLLPFQTTEAEKPIHAGEVYYLWEGLSSSYKLIGLIELNLMNTEDAQLQTYLKGLTTATFVLQIKKLEDAIKNEGFTVPPRPSSKTLQGGPGTGQEVQLTDKEVIRNIVGTGQVYITFYTRAIMACTRESVRNIFLDLLNDYINAYKFLLDIGKKRNHFVPPPPATAKKDSLNMNEVGVIWDELTARHLSQVNMEIFLASTKDKDLINLIKWGLDEIVIPQMEQLEAVLKNEGITVPPRPPLRQYQYSPGQVNRIRTSDDELLGLLTVAFQAYIALHTKALTTAYRDDLIQLCEKLLYNELKGYEKLMALAKTRHALSNPPVVSSYRI